MAKHRTKNPVKAWKNSFFKPFSIFNHSAFFKAIDQRPQKMRGAEGAWETLYVYSEHNGDDYEDGITWYKELFSTGERDPRGKLIEYCSYEWRAE